jgi:hypothetical protein
VKKLHQQITRWKKQAKQCFFGLPIKNNLEKVAKFKKKWKVIHEMFAKSKKEPWR